jgi:hypothetical protein
MMAEAIMWKLMIWTIRWWVRNCLDQFEKFKFRTEYGDIFVTIGRADPYPESFEEIDSKGRFIMRPKKERK